MFGYYPPTTVLRKGKVFRRLCLSVHRGFLHKYQSCPAPLPISWTGPWPHTPQTCTNLFNLDLTVQAPPHVMFKRVHLESYYARRKPKHPHHPRRYSQSCSLCSTDYRQAGGSYLTEIPSCCLSFNIV